jgi:glutaredoxin
MKAIRWLLGSLILFFNWLFTPRSIKRPEQQQNLINQQTASLKLYQFESCPFCVKVRRFMKREALHIETRDAKRCNTSRDELLTGGGRVKVPCLRIEDASGDVRWMYESSDIISYLEGVVATA